MRLNIEYEVLSSHRRCESPLSNCATIIWRLRLGEENASKPVDYADQGVLADIRQTPFAMLSY